MREYWQTSRKRYGLPMHLYTQVIGVIRDYERMKVEYERMINQATNLSDDQLRENNPTDIINKEAIAFDELSKKLRAVEQARYGVPEEYRNGVWDNTLYGLRFPVDADRTTYWRHKKTFVQAVAENLNWI